MTFQECVVECSMNQELVSQFDRLRGANLVSIFKDKRPPIVRMIDEATGYDKVLDAKAQEDIALWIAFVFECIWTKVDLTDD